MKRLSKLLFGEYRPAAFQIIWLLFRLHVGLSIAIGKFSLDALIAKRLDLKKAPVAVVVISLVLFSNSSVAQSSRTYNSPASSTITVTFELDMNGVANLVEKGTVGIRGNIAPLAWEKTYPMTDVDGDGVYTAVITFDSKKDKQWLRYKYVYGNVVWEFEQLANRVLALNGAPSVVANKWNIYVPFLENHRLSAAQLQEELNLIKNAYSTIHPGLFRYNSEEAMALHFKTLEDFLQQDRTLPELYLAYSRFLAKIKCGHTYCNFYNQPDEVKFPLFQQADRVPFTFKLLERRMIVTHDLSESRRLEGAEILSINDIPVPTILDSLLLFVKADGGNDAKRLYDLQVTGLGNYEWFDVYFSLVFNIKPNALLQIQARDLKTGAVFNTSVSATTTLGRKAMLKERYPETQETAPWQFFLVDEQTASLKLTTFTTWNFTMDWKQFLENAARELKEKQIKNLIIDIRGNEGGADDALSYLAKLFVSAKIVEKGAHRWLRYKKIPNTLRPYLSTWDDSFFNLENKVVPTARGYFRLTSDRPEDVVLSSGKNGFPGQIYLITDAGNSSLTFLMAQLLKDNDAAILVGQDTGGNRKGINGGMIFFLNLPHSRIEMDIPVFATFPLTDQPDEGITPHVLVKSSEADILQGMDPELEAIKRLIKQKQ
ncbi:MAG: S41 family peptidase [Saprospiraceae bacterium]